MEELFSKKKKHAIASSLGSMVLEGITWLQCKMPLQENIVLECENDLEDNPRAIYEYLIKAGWERTHRIIWLVKNVDQCKRLYRHHNVTFINRTDRAFLNRIKLSFYMNTSKWIVFSHPWWFEKKRNNQIVLNVWHGIGMKGFVGDQTERSKKIDFAIAPSIFSKELFSQGWDQKKIKILEYPRQDFLLDQERWSDMDAIFPSRNCIEKIVMCMPTFRQAKGWTDSALIDKYALGVVKTEEEFIRLNDYLKINKVLMLVKLHPLQDTRYIQMHNLSNIRYITNQELFDKKVVLYKLLGCCDALLTDVSSVYNDYLLLDKPVGFFMDNFSNYERGYKVSNPLDYMPGERIYSFDDFLQFLGHIVSGEDGYSSARKKTYHLFHSSEDANNSAKVVEWLFSIKQ